MKRIELEHKGMFHAVGQGLFHTAQVNGNKDGGPGIVLRYVYDCGTSSSSELCARRVREYRRSLPEDAAIDVLFLSHLHADHVSGLPYLLEGRIRVRKVVMPYLYPWERAIVYAQSTEQMEPYGGLPPWFPDFIVAPAAYFHRPNAEQPGVQEVAFIGGHGNEEGEGRGINHVEGPEGPVGEEDSTDATWIHETPVDAQERRRIEQNDSGMALTGPGMPEVKVLNAQSVLANPVWLFLLFNRTCPVEKTKRLKEEYDRIRKGLSLEEFIRDRAKMGRLTSAYREMFDGKHGLNSTSLSVFSCYRPWEEQESTLLVDDGRQTLGNSTSGESSGGIPERCCRSGFLFTGDLPVNAVWSDYCEKFELEGGAKGSEVLVYQTPHHGSIHNWNPEQTLLKGNPVYVVTAARHSTHHPGDKVVGDILAAKRSLVRVDEEFDCRYELRVWDSGKTAKERVQFLDSWAKNDRRPGVGLKNGIPDIDWVRIPAGPFKMGDGEKTVVIPEPYWIARYPVTVAQYEAFVKANGYDKREYWTEAGWTWREEGNVKGPDPSACYGLFGIANHPQVGVSWYEAMAFCKWLTKRLREMDELDESSVVTLPTESQWEKAARGTDGREYPWGNMFDANKLNCSETGIDVTSPVGCFPEGVSPYGCLDMVGNVWEWCRSKWSGEVDDIEGTERRVVRGGSFGYFARGVRCAFRLNDLPSVRDGGSGFRCMASPFSSPMNSGRMTREEGDEQEGAAD